MVTQTRRLPPDSLDFQIYRLVKVDQLSTRQTAKSLQLSQTRICQIVKRVNEYVGDLLVSTDSPEHRRRETLIAEQIAAEQVAALNREAMNAFRRSQESVIFVEKGEDGEDEEVTRWKNPGEVRYLMAAARLAFQQTKLPTPKLEFLAEDDLPEQDWEDEDESDEEDEESPESPPVGACSATPASQSVASPTAPVDPHATTDLKGTCVSGVSPQLMAKLNATTPVHPTHEAPKTAPEHPSAMAPGQATKQEARRKFFGS